jgi:hypothetical protein
MRGSGSSGMDHSLELRPRRGLQGTFDIVVVGAHVLDAAQDGDTLIDSK